jgi:penicillin amidase
VEAGMNSIGKLELSFNWVLCDQKGNIGYQMSGLAPKRKKGISGFVPLPGWDPANDWQGIYAHDELPRVINPKEGFIITANQDLNHLTPKTSSAWPINMPMGSERADRITKLLSLNSRLSVEDCKKMHYDLFSSHAEDFMKVIKPILSRSKLKNAHVLLEWDLKYDVDSKGAALFEFFYRALLSKVFGYRSFGEAVSEHLFAHTGIFMDFHANFDRIVLAETSPWFGTQNRTEIFTSVLVEAFENWDGKAWGVGQQLILKNMLLGGKLPRFFGIDRGPITLPGGRATILQGQIYTNGARKTSFAPSIRYISDMSEECVYTNLIGGPSDRFWSKYYVNDVDNWVKGRYKKLSHLPNKR